MDTKTKIEKKKPVVYAFNLVSLALFLIFQKFIELTEGGIVIRKPPEPLSEYSESAFSPTVTCMENIL